MREDPELPDFDSMSQEELIEWLEQLARSQGGGGATFFDQQEPPSPGDDSAAAWTDWMDETQPIREAGPRSVGPRLPAGDAFAEPDDEERDEPRPVPDPTPGELSEDAIRWLAELASDDVADELPDISDYKSPPPENLNELLDKGAQDDPLDWLDRLEGAPVGRAEPPAPTKPAADEIDDAYEDDERLDDLEDESLYSRRARAAATLQESLQRLRPGESDEFSTQSMAPAPDAARNGEASVKGPVAAARARDSLSQAFLLQDQDRDLEAWYESRLRAISEDAAPPASDPPKLQSTKPPPPGLAAAIYSARGKIESGEWQAALQDYETLLLTSAGLEWVVADMRQLVQREEFQRNPSLHRVLGDALMRQGHLDAALALYQRALAML